MKPCVSHLLCLTALYMAWRPTTVAAEDPFVQKYLASEKVLLDHYAHNRRVTIRSKVYELRKDNTSQLLMSSEFTAIVGEPGFFRSKGRKDYEDAQGRQIVGQLSGGLRIPGDGYTLTQGASPDSYLIESQISPKFAAEDTRSRPLGPALNIFMYGGDDGTATISDVLRYSGKTAPHSTAERTFLSASSTTWQGKPAIAFKVRSSFGGVVSTHLSGSRQ